MNGGMLLGGLGVAGCAKRAMSAPGPDGRPLGAEGRSRGRLIDLEAAVRWAATRSEMAVVDRTERVSGGEGRGAERIYRLTTMDDRTVVLRIETDDWDGDLRGVREFGLRAEYGLFGDRRIERRLVALVSKRLQDLARRS